MLHLLLRKLSRDQFEELIRDAECVMSDRIGPKLLRTRDGRCVKLFRRRHRLTTDLLYPPALRFCIAAQRLARRDVPSVTVESAWRVPAVRRHVIVYRELPGSTLREALCDSRRRETLLEGFARFLARLHAAGVYFRAIHFGNVIVLEEDRFALIDIAECRFRRWSLGVGLRARNWRHVLAKKEDAAAVRAFGLERFLERYVEASGLAARARRHFAAGVRRAAARIELASNS